MKTISQLLLLILLTDWILTGCKPVKENGEKVTTNFPTLCAPQPSDAVWYQTDQVAPIFEGLGDLSYPITTPNSDAQKYFDQGLILSYAFNHAEAARSFYYATKLDSTCAMCHWGYAYVLGPNYNAGMEPDHYERAYDAVQKAIHWSQGATEKEKDLIMALSKRYIREVPDKRTHLDSAYAEAMKSVYLKYPDDQEIGALYAESVMDMHPWDLWDKQGKPKAWTPEIISILENLLKKYPKHPGLHHFYIHAVEASFSPERGLASAKIFDEGLVPKAGHLVHMPSHIYIRTGDYHLGSLANINAVRVDSSYVSACNAQGVYPLAYFPHNFHFLAATATMEGKKEWAYMGAEKVRAHVNKDLMKDPNWGTLQHYYTIPYFVMVKFGDWEHILEMADEDSSLVYPQIIQAYARGFAHLGQNDLAKSKSELEKLKQLALKPELEEITIWYINPATTIAQIADYILSAEILASEKKFEESIILFKKAIDIEDALNYNEPPDWFFSVRHHLGAVLLESGQYDEAIEVYLKDLSWLPKNGWAMHGLKKAYELKKDQKGLEKINKELSSSWAYADIPLSTSRIK